MNAVKLVASMKNIQLCRGSMQLKWERTLNFTLEGSCVVCVHVFKIKVFFNPVVDSDGGELLISALNPNETVFLQQLVICSNSKPAADFVPCPS